jgi:hypothetical protein
VVLVVVVPVVVVVLVVVRVVVVVTGRVVVVVGLVVLVIVVVLVGRVVVVVVVLDDPPPQVTPFSAKEVGVEFAPLPVPMKPGVTVPPEGSEPFQASFFTVTLDEPVLQTPLQPWLTVWPFGKLKVRVQADRASPVFLTVSPPWKPFCQEPATA